MVGREEIVDVIAVLEAYFDGLYHADRKILADVFHRDARYINTVEGDYMNYSMPEYFDIVEHRTPPADSGVIRADKVISIEMGGPRMAFAKVSMTMLGRQYLDFLTLTCHEDRWRIMSKVFSYIADE